MATPRRPSGSAASNRWVSLEQSSPVVEVADDSRQTRPEDSAMFEVIY